MPRPTFHVLVLLALWLLPACRTVPNPGYCEGDPDCEEGWTCDVPNNTCLPPSGAECSNDTECTREDEPICDLAASPRACRGCASTRECMDKDPTRPFCSPDGACLNEMPPDCMASEDCTAVPTLPICDTIAGECKRCNDAGGNTACEERDNGSAPFCLMDGENIGACVQCLESMHCTEATAPVCDPNTKTCGDCKAHSDCDAFSGVCSSGGCAPESEIVYVQQMNSSDTNDCSKAAPCTTINRAVAVVNADKQNKHFIRILDSVNYGENITLNGVALSIVGNDDTRITAPTDNRPAITVEAGTSLTLDTLAVRSVGNNAPGIQCLASSSSVQLDGVIVHDNPGYGIEVSGCPLTVKRSLITGNESGGITVTGAGFDITNSFIVGNGSTTSEVGGVVITNSTSKTPQRFAFNTVLDNLVGAGAAASGVACTVLAADIDDGKISATSSIIRRGSASKPATSGNCVWVYSNIEEIPLTPPTTNIDDPCTIAYDSDDLPRIGNTSPCRNSGESGTGIDTDYDGQLRPDGSGADKPDMGADEIVAPPAPAEYAP
jgi:hypothetical protein